MLRDILEMTDCNAKVVLRVFDMSGCNNAMGWTDNRTTCNDIVLTLDNVDEYKSFTISCIVPRNNKLIIEGTID